MRHPRHTIHPMMATPDAVAIHATCRVSARQVAWMATASGVAIIGWIVWRGWRIHPPPGMVLVPAGAYPVGGGGAPGRDSTTVRLDAFFIDSAEVGVAAYRR